MTPRFTFMSALFAVILSFTAVQAMASPSDTFAFGHPGKASAVTRTVKITMKGIRFSIQNIDVKSGETVKFVLTNKDGFEHEFALGTVDEQAEHRVEMQDDANKGVSMGKDPNAITVPSGKTVALIWTFTGPSTIIEFDCDVPGHYEAGMRGTITIRK